MTTLRDALEGAFDSAGSEVAEAPSEAPSSVEPAVETRAEPAAEKPAVDRARDEIGRYTRKDAVKDALASAEKPAEPEAPKVDLPTPKKPPSSWKKDYWGQWEKLASDPELAKLQDYIEQRESEFATGVSTYRNEAMKAKAIQDAVAPFLPIMQQHGIQPEVEIGNLLNAHHTLVSASPQQKLQMFAKLATDYGVPLQAIGNETYNPGTDQMMQLMQELNSLKSGFGQMYQTQQQRENAQIQAEIEAFKANAPHFEAVREQMAGLLQSGLAPDLKSAYDKAVRLNDDVWKQTQAQQAAEAEKQRQAALAKKQATAVSTRSVAPTAQARDSRSGNDVRSILSSKFDELGGRI